MVQNKKHTILHHRNTSQHFLPDTSISSTQATIKPHSKEYASYILGSILQEFGIPDFDWSDILTLNSPVPEGLAISYDGNLRNTHGNT